MPMVDAAVGTDRGRLAGSFSCFTALLGGGIDRGNSQEVPHMQSLCDDDPELLSLLRPITGLSTPSAMNSWPDGVGGKKHKELSSVDSCDTYM